MRHIPPYFIFVVQSPCIKVLVLFPSYFLIFGYKMKMLLFFTFIPLLIGLTGASNCFNEVEGFCFKRSSQEDRKEIQCSSKYSGAHNVFPFLHTYVQQHIDYNFQYLLMSSHFESFDKNREGFSKLFRKLSDSTWDDAIHLIKYITRRGGYMNFNATSPLGTAHTGGFIMNELESMSRALDISKNLAVYGHVIHSEVTSRGREYHDAETLSYIENELVHKHAKTVRELAGHTNDLKNLIKHSTKSDASLSIYLFDEYLKKMY